LFYAQHQFERAYWRRGEDWSFVEAALEGSTFLKLPRLLQWFTGNIGFHHIHHLNSRIPNYRLQACHDSHPMFAQVTPMTIVRSLQAFGLKLFDETSGRLVCFRVIGPRPSRRSPVS
jgi:omega-6 fatty acid desaturase (delta-12 desaturase)